MANVPGFDSITKDHEEKYLANAACHAPGIANEKVVTYYDNWSSYDKVI